MHASRMHGCKRFQREININGLLIDIDQNVFNLLKLSKTSAMSGNRGLMFFIGYQPRRERKGQSG